MNEEITKETVRKEQEKVYDNGILLTLVRFREMEVLNFDTDEFKKIIEVLETPVSKDINLVKDVHGLHLNIKLRGGIGATFLFDMSWRRS